jgi:hypothetical protein
MRPRPDPTPRTRAASRSAWRWYASTRARADFIYRGTPIKVGKRALQRGRTDGRVHRPRQGSSDVAGKSNARWRPPPGNYRRAWPTPGRGRAKRLRHHAGLLRRARRDTGTSCPFSLRDRRASGSETPGGRRSRGPRFRGHHVELPADRGERRDRGGQLARPGDYPENIPGHVRGHDGDRRMLWRRPARRSRARTRHLGGFLDLHPTLRLCTRRSPRTRTGLIALSPPSPTNDYTGPPGGANTGTSSPWT